jgi:hypothetical protein
MDLEVNADTHQKFDGQNGAVHAFSTLLTVKRAVPARFASMPVLRAGQRVALGRPWSWRVR